MITNVWFWYYFSVIYLDSWRYIGWEPPSGYFKKSFVLSSFLFFFFFFFLFYPFFSFFFFVSLSGAPLAPGPLDIVQPCHSVATPLCKISFLLSFFGTFFYHFTAKLLIFYWHWAKKVLQMSQLPRSMWQIWFHIAMRAGSETNLFSLDLNCFFNRSRVVALETSCILLGYHVIYSIIEDLEEKKTCLPSWGHTTRH